jgi:hypothetical protein
MRVWITYANLEIWKWSLRHGTATTKARPLGSSRIASDENRLVAATPFFESQHHEID